MKTTTTIAILLATSALLHGQSWLQGPSLTGFVTRTQLRQEQTVNRPSSADLYVWNPVTKSYETYGNAKFTYDVQGREIKAENFSEQKLTSQTITQYDASGNEQLIQSLNFSITGDTVHGTRTQVTYDGTRQTFYQYEQYNTAQHVWIISSGNKNILQKDAQGNILSATYQRYVQKAYVNTSKEEFTYTNNGQILTVVQSEWTGSEWIPYSRSYDISWQDAVKNQVKSYKTQVWDGDKWVEESISTGTTSGGNWVVQTDTLSGTGTQPLTRRSVGLTPVKIANNRSYFYFKSEEYHNGTWETISESAPALLPNGHFQEVNTDAFSRSVVEFDNYENQVLYTTESYEDGNWVLDNGTRYTRTYDVNGNNTTVSYESYSSTSKTWQQGSKIAYTDFKPYEQPNGVDAESLSGPFVQAYPNPSSNGLFQLSASLPYQVRNAAGVLILETESNRIYLNGQPEGIYFLQIRMNGTVVQKKLVIRQ